MFNHIIIMLPHQTAYGIGEHLWNMGSSGTYVLNVEYHIAHNVSCKFHVLVPLQSVNDVQ